MRQLLREPLTHFLLLGLVLFVLYGVVAPGGGGDHRLVVSRAQVDALAAQHEKLWGRAPTPDELAGLVDTWVRDEILYREGVALGLDRDDAVVKRRVRQKLEVLAEEELSAEPASDSALAAYLAANPARFTRPADIAFEQVLLGPAEPGPALDRAVAVARSALARGADPATVGQPTLLPHRMPLTPLDLVARDFGTEFAERLPGLPLGEWSGPVGSGFGAHLVRVNQRTESVVPPLDAIRAEVTREWENERRTTALAEHFRRLRAQYDVQVEGR
ncbi:MAG: peptidylprolyl isomerase [Gemmatimonadales bacterium]|nr:peptidylprolyl isomerase [Gemmatimonadales bacterium]